MSTANGNQALGTVEIELDRPRRLLCDFNAICSLEEKTGVNLLRRKEGEPHPFENPNMGFVRALLWAFLIHESPKLTVHEVGRLIGFDQIGYVTERCAEAFVLAMPKAKPGDAGATPDPPSPSTGSSSGLSPATTSA